MSQARIPNTCIPWHWPVRGGCGGLPPPLLAWVVGEVGRRKAKAHTEAEAEEKHEAEADAEAEKQQKQQQTQQQKQKRRNSCKRSCKNPWVLHRAIRSPSCLPTRHSLVFIFHGLGATKPILR